MKWNLYKGGSSTIYNLWRNSSKQQLNTCCKYVHGWYSGVPVVENKEALHYQHKHVFISRVQAQASLPQEGLRISSPGVNITHHRVHVESIQHFNRTQQKTCLHPSYSMLIKWKKSVYDAHSTTALPPLGRSDHNLILLTPQSMSPLFRGSLFTPGRWGFGLRSELRHCRTAFRQHTGM